MAGESTGAVGGSPAGGLVIEFASVNSAVATTVIGSGGAGAGTVSSAGLVATVAVAKPAGATVAGAAVSVAAGGVFSTGSDRSVRSAVGVSVDVVFSVAFDRFFTGVAIFVGDVETSDVPGERVFRPPVATTTPELVGDVAVGDPNDGAPLGSVAGDEGDVESGDAATGAAGVPGVAGPDVGPGAVSVPVDADGAVSVADAEWVSAVGSADATHGHASTAVPIPNATARPPIRPT